jgi:hypothetical protein
VASTDAFGLARGHSASKLRITEDSWTGRKVASVFATAVHTTGGMKVSDFQRDQLADTASGIGEYREDRSMVNPRCCLVRRLSQTTTVSGAEANGLAVTWNRGRFHEPAVCRVGAHISDISP